MPRALFATITIAIITICLLPILGVIFAALSGSTQTLADLADTVLWRYSRTTLILGLSVAVSAIVIGTTTAWLVVKTEFAGRRFFEITLILPLAFPAYVLAYAYTDILDHPGIVQSTLRQITGWGPRDYWFPEIRSLAGAAVMLSLVLYPYVYLLARAAFLQQGASAFSVARSLGATPLEAFWRVSLPMARPAIAAGALLVVMETIADFGTVAHFSVQTFATGIYTSWYGLGDRAAAAQLALALFSFACLIAALEQINRGAAQFHSKSTTTQSPRKALRGWRHWSASAICALPVILGVIIPVIALVSMGFRSEQVIFSARYGALIQNTFLLGLVGAIVTVGAAIILGSFNRHAPGVIGATGLLIGRLGYAVPGGVIAVGLMVPFASFDNWFDARMQDLFGLSTGLLITGSIWLMVSAYMIRFLAAAIGAYDSGLAHVSPNIDAAARVLGRGPWGLFTRVHLPVLRPSILTAALIVFVDTVKELPATLILRPSGFDTLAVHTFRLAADERLNGAAVPGLMIAAIGLMPVLLLCRQIGTTLRR